MITNFAETLEEVILVRRGCTTADLHLELEHILGDRRHMREFVGRFEQLAPEAVLDTIPMLEQEAGEVVEILREIARRAATSDTA